MPDPAMLAAIRADPNDESCWLALAGWLWDNGRDDEAAAVRTFWPAIRDTLAAGRCLDSALEDLRRNAKILGDCARGIEMRSVR